MGMNGQEWNTSAEGPAELYAMALQELFEPARQHGGSQRALARAVGRDASVVSRYFSGRIVAPRTFVDGLVAYLGSLRMAVSENEVRRIHELREAAQEVSYQRKARFEYLEERIAALSRLVEQYEERVDEEQRLRDECDALTRGRQVEAEALAILAAERGIRVEELSVALAAAADEVVALRDRLRAGEMDKGARSERSLSAELVVRPRGQLERVRRYSDSELEAAMGAAQAALLRVVELKVVVLQRMVDLLLKESSEAPSTPDAAAATQPAPGEPPYGDLGTRTTTPDEPRNRVDGASAEDLVRSDSEARAGEPLVPAPSAEVVPVGGHTSVPGPAPRVSESAAQVSDTACSDSGWDADWESRYQSVRRVVAPDEGLGSSSAIYTTPVEPDVPYRLAKALPGDRHVPVPAGTSVRAIAAGIVTSTGESRSGRTVIIRHDDGALSVYSHLSRLAVIKDQMVHVGQRIGESGTESSWDGPGLGFGVLWRRHAGGAYQSIDPVAYLWHVGVPITGIVTHGQKLPDESFFAIARRVFSSETPEYHGRTIDALARMARDCPYAAPRVLDIFTSYLRPPPQGHRQRSPGSHKVARSVFSGVLYSLTPGLMVDLSGTDLWRLNLRQGYSRDLNLGNACLAEVWAKGANLRRCHFFGADLSGADLRGANLSSATGLTAAALSRARIDSKTALPTPFKIEYQSRGRWTVIDTSSTEVGTQLTKSRIRARMSIDQISTTTGLGVETLRLLESGGYDHDGITAPSELIRRYADALGINADPLILALTHATARPNGTP
ncbi:peptidoglycan DD-metalloendopeptidase family protein [Streptomyces erythrochromogenes]|uniref:peptidoglycan DD-metalloendopeptidase family protein n=1 Tax=Streptomyces erythrochromogenes TaxID=285574 RepID=UPI0036415C42